MRPGPRAPNRNGCPTSAPPMSRRAWRRPSGWGGPATRPATPPLGSFAWMELATSNYEAAFDFYSKLFGWQALHRMDMGPQGVYLIFGADGAQRGGIYKLNQERSSRPYWLAYAEVASADAAA